ncbi:MAG: hypothetical protein FD145_716 [Candidatus Saganbacteria bacterium]|uniref:Uncharacterized protein n=1 Tax=Candidatus Saganbacteria bacterium TaxID=2575572 RepID=A0A833L3T6_UNCSA|nr:MAG: hypothetical protein FD145_716 [Candidatus Saganbacteria bacterium]
METQSSGKIGQVKSEQGNRIINDLKEILGEKAAERVGEKMSVTEKIVEQYKMGGQKRGVIV